MMPHANPQPPPPPRRGAGELEAAVLSVLWEAGRALSPGEVQQALTGQAGAPELSYSTVVTILSRLHAKQALERRRDGRAFRYVPVADEAGLAARRLAAMLGQGPDPPARLSRVGAGPFGRGEPLLAGPLRQWRAGGGGVGRERVGQPRVQGAGQRLPGSTVPARARADRGGGGRGRRRVRAAGPAGADRGDSRDARRAG